MISSKRFEHKAVHIMHGYGLNAYKEEAFNERLQEILDEHRDWRFIAVCDLSNNQYTLFFTRDA